MFPSQFLPLPAFEVDVETGSVTDITPLLVRHYLAWLLVGQWATMGTILSPPCVQALFMYPVVLNIAVVVILTTSFACRQNLGW